MHFKKLELVGFKSFCDKTTLDFEPGITAIVGPNGCGKSNLLDGMRWVLGEQSAKSLRGSQMQDVIFNGTDLKEPLGMAEVTLSFDNQSRFFNFDHPELAITRRLFRSGESEYLLNKTTVRLKDILDILLGTGVGAESYSIVAQGKIDLVLSSHPEDRRLVFDEAAGITKYKSQKRETMRKLEETEQNLQRVNDIIAEVKRQITSLERQAAKARRYRQAFEELKLKETKQALLQKKELFTQKEQLAAKIQGLGVSECQISATLQQEELKISQRQQELKTLEDKMLAAKNELLNLENLLALNTQHINFNQERINELLAQRQGLQAQISSAKEKITGDEEKLELQQQEYLGLEKVIEGKAALLTEQQGQIDQVALAIKNSLENITKLKKDTLELTARLANKNNEITEFNSQQQIYLARQRRLEIEKAKVFQEKAITKMNLDKIMQEIESLRNASEEMAQKINAIQRESEKENSALSGISRDIDAQEKQRLSLESHKEFIEKLKTRYEDISESMQVKVYLDKLPEQDLTGLVIKIKQSQGLELNGEAKPIELDTQKIYQKINDLQQGLISLENERSKREARIAELHQLSLSLNQELRSQELVLSNKEATRLTAAEQFDKISAEEELICLELADLDKELAVLNDNLNLAQSQLQELHKQEAELKGRLEEEQESVSKNSQMREATLVAITQLKTELESLHKRIFSDGASLKILEDALSQEQQNLEQALRQVQDGEAKAQAFQAGIEDCQRRISQAEAKTQEQRAILAELQEKYRQASEGSGGVIASIESHRQELGNLKNSLHELQMQAKDIDYRYASIAQRMLQAYKLDLENLQEFSPDTQEPNSLAEEIVQLKQKLDSYGTVNLVAIEEYDELKKRYDFLIQQQTDLVTSKDSLHQAILKLNRTTKQMFLETFQRVREEFRNYFRMLFGGGDAQVFLIDEQDPLESGIELICRPPGKKLQNVLLLSGGEKSLSAIALIFAILKVKPSPFCILDEIDAALDEANIERFSNMLQEFAKDSQFIVITHNKRTIANADVMYGITMEQSGVSKIVSVKFAQEKKEPELEPEATATELV